MIPVAVDDARRRTAQITRQWSYLPRLRLCRRLSPSVASALTTRVHLHQLDPHVELPYHSVRCEPLYGSSHKSLRTSIHTLFKKPKSQRIWRRHTISLLALYIIPPMSLCVRGGYAESLLVLSFLYAKIALCRVKTLTGGAF